MALNDELSSVAGWMSIACWYASPSAHRARHTTARSPHRSLIAVYYTLCDMTLLAQIYYYRHTHPTHIGPPLPTAAAAAAVPSESAPLLGPPPPDSTEPSKSRSPPSSSRAWRKAAVYALAVCFVIGTGLVAWRLNRPSGGSDGEVGVPGTPGKEEDVLEWKSQLIGWCSAVLYLGSRIPQILKNRITKCEGLSLALFIFAVAGNVAYVLSICIKSMEWRHLLANSSWLAGSGLTVFLDFIVLGQFFYYRRERQAIVADQIEDQ